MSRGKMDKKTLSREEAERALSLLENPRSFLPLYYGVLSIQTQEQASDWLAASAGDDAEFFLKSQLLEGIRDRTCTDLQGFVLFRLRKMLPHAETVH